MLNETPALAPDGQPYRLLTLRNNAGMVVTLMDWGATLLSARIPLSDGSVREALLGCASPECYQDQAAFLGASIGRYANRIANSRYTFDGETVTLSPSQGVNQLHGGPEGFDKRRWQIVNQNDRQVLFALSSDDGDQGFPGNLGATVQYRLTDDNRISITYRATVDKPCPVNMTNHAYFNLSGDKRKITEHQLMIPVTRILETTSQFIPTGHMQDVKDSPFDFTISHSIGMHLYDDDEQLHWNKGYNHCYILKEESSDTLLTAAVLSDPFSGRKLTVRTDLPGVLLYTSGYLAPTPDIGVCLETQYFPDTPSHPHFPSCLLMPGEEYLHRSIYTFER